VQEQKRLLVALGVMGFLMPLLSMGFALAFGGDFNQPQFLTSVSATHYSNAYLLFEGLLFAMGVIMLLYRGYDNVDRLLFIIVGIGSLLLVLFPCYREGGIYRNFVMVSPEVAHQVHFIFSIVVFVGYAFIIGFRFTKRNKKIKKLSHQKKRRNILYIICAILIAASVVIGYVGKNMLNIEMALYIGEFIAFWAFSFAFLAKGGAILKDK